MPAKRPWLSSAAAPEKPGCGAGSTELPFSCTADVLTALPPLWLELKPVLASLRFWPWSLT